MAFQGLPPVPKSLSGFFNQASAESRESPTKNVASPRQSPQSRPSPPRVPPRSSPRDPPPPPPSAFAPARKSLSQTSSASSLDFKLAVLRKEMAGLRQLDFHLMNQLWSLSQSVQDLKVIMSDRASADLDLVSPQSGEGWDGDPNDHQSAEYYRYLHRLGFGSPALAPRNLDPVNEGDNLSSSASSISSAQSGPEQT